LPYNTYVLVVLDGQGHPITWVMDGLFLLFVLPGGLSLTVYAYTHTEATLQQIVLYFAHQDDVIWDTGVSEEPWREILFMAVLFVWGLYKLITEGFR
jgi:hypothetical protein